MITVAELIALLRDCDPNASVSLLVDYDGAPVHTWVVDVDRSVSNYVVLRASDPLMVVESER